MQPAMNGNGSVLCGPPTPRKTSDLSSAERCAQMDAQIAHLNAVTRQVNALTREARDARTAAQSCEERWDASSEASKRHGDRHQAFVTRSFWQRLRWLFLGR